MPSERHSVVVSKGEVETFDYPFPASRNANVDIAERRTLQWIRRLQLAPEGRALSRLKATGFAQLAAWLLPWANMRTLELASDFTAALFLLDDAYDEGDLSMDPEAVERLNEKYLGELFGYVEPDMSDPLTRGLLDVRDRIKSSHPHFFLNRWLAHFQFYYEANLWEANNRRRARTPCVDEYLLMRRYSGAVYTYCDLLELLLERPLPLEVVQHPTIQCVRDICNDILCWTNDYFSLGKELRSGDVHNLILVLRDNHAITLEEAIARLKQMHDERIAEYQDVKEKVLALWDDEATRLYIGAADAMIAGNQRWALEARRYSGLESLIARAG
ncbi:terpene cyclase [Sorangium cellulosum]|uniref:Terpene synthase n=1 Tax=Sorangium cellulosum TaxID=56 RepID=A0A150PLC1_SORCE|nr:terpene cyclase [Sorangium cellulosum]